MGSADTMDKGMLLLSLLRRGLLYDWFSPRNDSLHAGVQDGSRTCELLRGWGAGGSIGAQSGHFSVPGVVPCSCRG